ncbi:Putative uncharacterized oxidoreductase [Cladobotryum mycophilum]|uniref:Uncharacterized oxidoreductase n=1 Tax=Cladobotryum mycophilum TaxID=491253 RepID=A0ABR0SPS5_9HYPO
MSSTLAFITGATGFIGSQIVRFALDEGFRVRLSVRKHEQIENLKTLFPNAAVEFVIIPDFSKENAFHDALDGVHTILHIASPMPGKGSDLQKDYLNPAIHGTVSILEAAGSAPSVKKVVIMSSILSLLPLGSLGKASYFAKENSGEKFVIDLEKVVAESGSMYQTSKILAHQASRDWIGEHKPKFGVVTVHPAFVVGPSLIQRTANEIDGINAWLWNSLRSGQAGFPSVLVDVRDVAEVTVRAAKSSVPSGTEFIASGPKITWTEIAELVKKEYPAVDVKLSSEGPPQFGTEAKAASELLGFKWRPIYDTIRAVADQQVSFV